MYCHDSQQEIDRVLSTATVAMESTCTRWTTPQWQVNNVPVELQLETGFLPFETRMMSW